MLLEYSFGRGQFSYYSTWMLMPHITWITCAECYFMEVVLIKWLLMGRYKEGKRPMSSWYNFKAWFMGRLQSSPLFQDALQPWSNCELLSIKYRALGAQIGRRVNLDVIEMIDYDLISIGDNCVFGSMVKFYAADDNEALPIQVQDHACVLDNSILMGGVVVGKEAVLGSCTLGPKDHRFADFSTSTGNQNGQPILLRKRKMEGGKG